LRLQYTRGITELPVISQPLRRSSALLDLLARRMRMQGESALGVVGLRPRHLLALTVLRDLGGSSQQALATTLQIDRTNLVGLLNELEADGLIERRRSAEDRRRHTVMLTDTGHERLAHAEFALAAVEDVVLASLTGAEREQLYALVQKATAGIVSGGC
jgi:MarR family transcriptional regulator, lower aerobic nicotinate degradation pathway regulator